MRKIYFYLPNMEGFGGLLLLLLLVFRCFFVFVFVGGSVSGQFLCVALAAMKLTL